MNNNKAEYAASNGRPNEANENIEPNELTTKVGSDKYYVNLMIAKVGSKTMTYLTKQQKAQDILSAVQVIITDPETGEELVNEFVELTHFQTGSVGYSHKATHKW